VDEFERLSQELAETRRERDAWREVALGLTDLTRKVTTAVIEQRHTVVLDAPTLGQAVQKTLTAYSRANGRNYLSTR
jgi:hypothetical protein